MSLLNRIRCTAACVLLAASSALGAGSSFSGIPDKANIVVRVDLDAISNVPQFTKAVADLQQKEGSPIGQLVLKGVLPNAGAGAGKVSSLELGLLFKPEGEPEPVGLIARGAFNSQAVLKGLEAAGFRKAGEASKLALYHRVDDNSSVTMLDANTIAASQGVEDLQKLVAAARGGQGGLRKSGKPLTAMLNAADSSAMFVGMEIPASAKESIAKAAKDNEAQLAMIPFAPALLAEVKNMSCAALALSAADGGRLYLAGNFADPASAKRMGDALNAAFPVVIQLAKQQVGEDDPAAAKRMDELAATKFVVDGSRVTASIKPSENMGKNLVGLLMDSLKEHAESASPAPAARGKAGAGK